MDWPRLKPEPTRLRQALKARNRRQLAAIVDRLATALAPQPTAPSAMSAGAPPSANPGAPRYRRLAEAAAELGVHSKTLRGWLEEEAPDALFRRRRLTLVVIDRFENWKHSINRHVANGS